MREREVEKEIYDVLCGFDIVNLKRPESPTGEGGPGNLKEILVYLIILTK